VTGKREASRCDCNHVNPSGVGTCISVSALNVIMLEDARVYHDATWRLLNLPTDAIQLSGAASVNKQDIEKYLRMLGQELQQRQITGEILLADGAVMLLVVQNREVTKDIDAYFPPGQAKDIREAAEIIARREGLPRHWLNDGVKGFFYTQPPTEIWAEYPGLRVYTTSLDYLLAMKVISSRPEDIDDIKALVKKLNIASAQDVLNIVKKYVPEQLFEPRIQYIVEEIFEEPL